jgi:hypothetical protein
MNRPTGKVFPLKGQQCPDTDLTSLSDYHGGAARRVVSKLNTTGSTGRVKTIPRLGRQTAS